MNLDDKFSQRKTRSHFARFDVRKTYFARDGRKSMRDSIFQNRISTFYIYISILKYMYYI